MRLTVGEIAKASGGEIFSAEPGTELNRVSTDSRLENEKGLFIALKGENFDGHDHMAEAAANGAACVLTERDAQERIPSVKVKSTHQALLDIAAYYRRRLGAKIVAVTGSAGKTTTKDMIASVLSQKYSVLKTQGNKNNLIGLPLTLLNLEDCHDIAVLEMGMNHFGEIRQMSLAAAPDIAVITNIGDAHIEFLGSREGILKAKLEIVEGLAREGIEAKGVVPNGFVPGDIDVNGLALSGKLILNGDDCLLAGLREKFPNAEFVSTLSVLNIKPMGLEGTECVFKIGAEDVSIHIPSPGTHMITNALLASAVGNALGLTAAQIAEGIKSFVPSGRRMQIHNAHGMRIIDDAYNANPSSVKAAAETLAGMKDAERKVCVLGDMLELGEQSERLHRETGEYVRNCGIDLFITVGTDAVHCASDMRFKDNESFINEWENILRPGDTVLFKASLGMRFEEIIRELVRA